MDNFTLTKEIRKILSHENGVAGIIAGAGTGKTTTLIAFIVDCIINRMIAPKCILVLTFSEAAKINMIDRLDELSYTKNKARISKVKVMTYHGFGKKIICNNPQAFGYQEPPEFLNTSQVKEDLAKILKINRSTVNAFFRDKEGIIKKDHKRIAREYENIKRDRGLLDFNDMIDMVLEEVNELKSAARSYDYLLVDELQDTSQKQAEMLMIMAKQIQTTVMVGDPKQNIYEFRGTDPDIWTRLMRQLRAKPYTLSKTRRVPASNLPFINAIGNEILAGAELKSDRDGDQIKLVTCMDGQYEHGEAQAEYIVVTINRLVSEGLATYEDFACLGRTSRHVAQFKITAEVSGIPFYEAYRRPNDRHAKQFRNAIRLIKHLRTHDEGRWELSDQKQKVLVGWFKTFGVGKEECHNMLNRLPAKGWKAMTVRSNIDDGEKEKRNPIYNPVREFVDRLRSAAETNDFEKQLKFISEAVGKLIRRQREKIEEKMAYKEVADLKLLAMQRRSIQRLRAKSLVLEAPQEGVYLGTIHSAKAKEWKYVFLLNQVNGVMPIFNAKTEKQKLEEKRLFYVGITRHTTGLFIMESACYSKLFKPNRDTKIHDGLSEFIESHKHLLEHITYATREGYKHQNSCSLD